MISRPTVLVLGAGASVPYGFPTGEGLVRQILQQRVADHSYRGIEEELVRLGCSAEDVKCFYSALRHSLTPSIDLFLERNPRFTEIGKLAIAIALIRHEKEATLFQHDRVDGDWYPILINALRCDPERLCENKLTIVTFNYDRSLLHAIVQSLVGFYALSRDQAVQYASQIRMIHVYGALGNLPGFGQPERAYSTSNDDSAVRTAAQGIRIFPEGEKHEFGFRDARNAIQEAERVYFLGFGFHEVNMQRLGRDTWPRNDMGKFWGTTFGLERQEIKRVRASLGAAHLNPSEPDPKEDVRLFIRRWVEFG